MKKFANPRPTESLQVNPQPFAATQRHENEKFEPLPPLPIDTELLFPLNEALGDPAVNAITKSGKIVFHMVGDTGSIKNGEPLDAVVHVMAHQIDSAELSEKPAFFFHLGDVVYYYGQAGEYYSQFYEPYSHYDAPIFAIPGNHDGDIDPDTNAPSLEAFVRNFLNAGRHVITKEAGDAHREAMHQPYVYFVLDAPFVRIIGLYTNVPSGGEVQREQYKWFVHQLKNAPADKKLIVAMHHPLYSMDTHHGSSVKMQKLCQEAFDESGRVPDAICTGHVHDYQRFEATFRGTKIPVLVAGSGGYYHLHPVSTDAKDASPEKPMKGVFEGVDFINYKCDTHGFLRITVDAHGGKGEYFAVPKTNQPTDAEGQLFDTFTF